MSDRENSWRSYISQQRRMEHRETQLWWLAITVIILLAITVAVVDFSGTMGFGSDGPFVALNSGLMRATLVIAVFLICAYFRDSIRRLRKSNAELLSDVRAQSELVERRNTELARLRDISDRLIGSMDVQDGLDLLLGTAMDVADAESASIILMDEETGRLDRLSARMVSASEACSGTHVKERLAQWVADRNQAVLVNSDVSTPEMRELEGCNVEVATLLSPISVSGKVLGVLTVAGKKAGGEFGQHDLDAVCTLAGQAALALEKMHLYRRLQEQVARLRSALHELKQAQASLIQSEKLASIGQLAGGVAHEINNPLLTILGRAEMVLADIDPTSPHARDLEIIGSETRRIASIVKNLLSFARVDKTGFMSLVDINEVVERTLELVGMEERSDNIELVTRLASGLPPVYAEKGELQQVYMNIVLNAYQAMKENGGTLTVETSRDNSGNAVAKFADTGPGIEADDMANIFEPFFTTKTESEGTGLGLSVSSSIAAKYNGKIEVQTRVGEGATFIVKLPVAEDAEKGLPEAAG